jgi:hypothetical protein
VRLTFEMMLRYIQIRDFFPLLEIDELDELLLSMRIVTSILSAKNWRILNLFQKPYRKVTTIVTDTRLLFDEISNAYPVVKEKLAADANLVVDTYFE